MRLIFVLDGAGELAAPDVAKLFFENVVRLFGVSASSFVYHAIFTPAMVQILITQVQAPF